ncbi:MAG: helix-turn-helix domain-containing protein [Actinocatenispora sp.]
MQTDQLVTDARAWTGPPLAASAAAWADPSGETWYTPQRVPGDLAGQLVTTWQARLGGNLRLVPDGCVEVLWIGNGTAWVCGPESVAWSFCLPAALPVYGVRFRPGVAGSALGFDTRELYNRRVAVADVLGGRAERELTERIAETADPSAGLGALHQAVRGWVSDARDPGPVAAALPRLLAEEPSITVAGVADALGLSDRQLHRHSVSAFGYGPATLRRILRLQRFLRLSRRPGGSTDLASLAVAAGYTDQPHLSRDCRTIAGASPAELTGRRVRSVHDGTDGGRACWAA